MNVRRLILVTFMLFVVAAGSAGRVDAWDIEWIDQFGTPGNESAGGTAVDSTGIYVAGFVGGALPGQSGAGSVDAYVRKYDADGHVLWTRQFGTPAVESATGIARDTTGIYVVGRTRGTLPGQVSAGSDDAFVRKYDADGNVVWTTQFGTAGSDLPFFHGIASHSSGIYVAGVTFGTFPGAPAGIGRDIFLARLDPGAGTVVWVRQFGIRDSGQFFLRVGGVAADDTGVYVATTVLQGVEQLAVLRKYDFEGDLAWSRELPGTLACGASFWGVAAHTGKAYVIGQWHDAYLADPEVCRNQGFDSGPVVGVLQAYNADGTLLWTRGIRGGTLTGKDAFTGGKDVTVSDGGIFVGANLTGSFPGHPPGGSRSDHSECPGLGVGGAFADKLDAYVRRYDFDGNVVWTHQFGSSVFEVVGDLAADGTSVYAVGDTSCQVADGTTFFGGQQDAFVVRIAIDPTSPSGLVSLVVGRLETLDDKGRFTPGEFNSLVQSLEAALSAIERGDAPLAWQILETFIGDVEQQRDRGTLSSADAALLIDGATAIIAEL